MLMWWRPAAGLGRGTLRWDLQSYLSILCARKRHIEVQAILEYPYHCQHTIRLSVKEFGNCLVHHAYSL